MQAVEGGRGRRALRLHRSNDPQLRPNTLFKGCSRELFLCSCPLSFLLLVSTSLLSRGSCPQFVCLRRRSQAFSLSLVENNNASHIQITPPSQPACTHYVTNYHLPDSTATNQPTIACPPASLDGGQGEHIFAALYALFPSSLSPNDFLAAVSLRKSRLRRREGGN